MARPKIQNADGEFAGLLRPSRAHRSAGHGGRHPRGAALSRARAIFRSGARRLSQRNAAAVAAAGFPEIAATLEKLASEAEQSLADLEQLEQRLTALEEKLIATLKSSQTEEQLFTARRELDAQFAAVPRQNDGRSTRDAGASIPGAAITRAVAPAAAEPFLHALMLDHIKILLRLYAQPAAAMSAILDQGSLLFASLAVLAATLLMPYWMPFSFYTPLLILAVVYVPGAVLLALLLGRLGAFWTVFERDYSPLLTCAAMALAATEFPLALAARWIGPPTLGAIAVALLLYFIALMFFAVRTVFGLENGISAGVVFLSWIPLVGAVFLWGPISGIVGYLASPFFLYFAYRYLGGEVAGLGEGMRSRQNFHRMLEAAAINPHDAEARYQLGLIYQQRHQYSEAIRQFESAVKIDPRRSMRIFSLAASRCSREG